MKYKNIKSMLHNFGHSFISGMNLVDNEFIFLDLNKLVTKDPEGELVISFPSGKITPERNIPPRVYESIGYYIKWLPKHLKNHDVDSEAIGEIVFEYRKVKDGYEAYVATVDDRGVVYRIKVNEKY